MDLGDSRARNAMNRHILDVQTFIKAKLNDIAQPRRHRAHEVEFPGFGELLRQWRLIEDNVTYALDTLSQRLDAKPSTQKLVQKPAHKPEEVVVSMKELDRFLDHMKNSWVEKIVAGKVLYVNCFDDKSQWEKPSTGYVKATPKPSRPSSMTLSWDQPAKRPVRTPAWDNLRRW
jgi:hypothetical protein